MALPLITYNPWNTNSEGMPQRLVFPEMVYLFEKNKSIL